MLRSNDIQVGETGAHSANFVRSKKDQSEGEGEIPGVLRAPSLTLDDLFVFPNR